MDAPSLDIEDRAACERYLQRNFAPAEEFEIREFRVLAGGVSGRTVRVHLSGGQQWVLKQALPKLRTQADWFSDPRRIHREALGMRVLGELAPAGSIPKLIFDDETHHVIGMEAVPEPHENWKTMLLAERGTNVEILDFGRLLGTIHIHGRNRRDEFRPAFEDVGFFETLRLEPYYEYVAGREPLATEFLERLIAATRQHRETLVHGDFSPKNVLICKGRLILLDHEVIHWGDPAFDVGFALTHLLSKAHHCRSMRLQNAAWNFWGFYFEKVAREWLSDPEVDFDDFLQRCVDHTLGCLLARVVGRSPLEYLTAEQRERQRAVVLRLIESPPPHLKELIPKFMEEIAA